MKLLLVLLALFVSAHAFFDDDFDPDDYNITTKNEFEGFREILSAWKGEDLAGALDNLGELMELSITKGTHIGRMFGMMENMRYYTKGTKGEPVKKYMADTSKRMDALNPEAKKFLNQIKRTIEKDFVKLYVELWTAAMTELNDLPEVEASLKASFPAIIGFRERSKVYNQWMAEKLAGQNNQ